MDYAVVIVVIVALIIGGYYYVVSTGKYVHIPGTSPSGGMGGNSSAVDLSTPESMRAAIQATGQKYLCRDFDSKMLTALTNSLSSDTTPGGADFKAWQQVVATSPEGVLVADIGSDTRAREYQSMVDEASKKILGESLTSMDGRRVKYLKMLVNGMSESQLENAMAPSDSGAASTPAWDGAANRKKVIALYHSVLFRKVDSAGIATKLRQMYAGKSLARIKTDMQNSAEAKLLSKLSEDDRTKYQSMITGVFTDFLHRFPDGSERNAALKSMINGKTKAWLIMRVSSTANAHLLSAPDASGLSPTDIQDAITLAFVDLDQREPTVKERTHYIQALKAKKISVARMREEIAATSESKEKMAKLAKLVASKTA